MKDEHPGLYCTGRDCPRKFDCLRFVYAKLQSKCLTHAPWDKKHQTCEYLLDYTLDKKGKPK